MSNILSVVVWAFIGLYLSVIALIHVPSVQKYAGEMVATAVANKLGTRVSVGRVDLGFLNRIIIDDVIILDQKGKTMLKVARMSVKIDVASLAQGRISVSTAQLFGANLSLYKPSDAAPANYQFALDSLASKDTTKQSTLDLRVNSFIMRHSSIAYDRLDVPPQNGKLTTDHIYLSDISANIQLKALRKDTINLNIRKLAFAEQSGLKLERLSLKLEGGASGLRLREMSVKMPHTNINIPKADATYEVSNGMPVWTTLRYEGEIAQSELGLVDAGCFVDALRSWTAPLSLTAQFYGTYKKTNVRTLKLTSQEPEMTIKAGGWIDWSTSRPQWHVDMGNVRLASNAVAMLYHSIAGAEKTMPNALKSVGQVKLSGVLASSAQETLNASVTVSTEAGSADADFSLLHDGRFTGTLAAKDIALKQLLDNDKLGQLTATVDVDGKWPKGNKPTMRVKGDVTQMDYCGYKYRNIALDGTYRAGDVEGKVSVDDPNANLAIEGSMVKQGNNANVKATAHISRVVPASLNLTKKWPNTAFSATLDADFSGKELSDGNGEVCIADFNMIADGNDYHLDRLNIKAGKTEGRRYLMLNSDFGHAEMVGRFNIATVASSFTDFVRRKLPTLPSLPKSTVVHNNDFLVSATITDTEWLRQVFNVPLRIDNDVTINGKVNDQAQYIYLNCVAPKFHYAEKPYSDAAIAVTSPGDDLHCDVKLTKILDNGDQLNLGLTGRANDNKLSTVFSWGNTKGRRIAGQFTADTQFLVEEGMRTAHIDIQPSHINIDGATWHVGQSSVAYRDKHIVVDNFSIRHDNQHILIDGTASRDRNDSVTIDLNGVDVSYVLNLVNFHAVEFGGQASGRAFVRAPFGELSAEGNIVVSKFTFEEGQLGTLDAAVKWNKAEKQIDINGIANDGPEHLLFIDGFISPSRSYIDMAMRAEGTRLDFMRSFTSSFSKDVDGIAHGHVTLAGPFSNMNLTGQLVVNGQATIDPLGCRYTLKEDTVNFVPDDIILNNAPIYDYRGNRGLVTGGIHHKHLTQMTYDLDVKASNLLVYDFKEFGDDTFYGTVFGTGQVGIHGKSGELTMDIDIRPEENTTFVYNVSNPEAISTQEFIHWNDVTPQQTYGTNVKKEQKQRHFAERLPGTDTYLNFMLDVTPDATMKLLMDSKTNDYITLNGHGTIRASYYNKGSFNMYGTYTVDRGTYGITIQDIIKKNFTFREGGTIVFGGNPFDAALGLQAVYTVNGVSLSDLNIGNSFSNNTIRVNCLMNIGGQARQPVVDFDIDMPTVSTDEKQMVRSVLNSEDEMNQQVLYLLGIGRFYPQGSNNASSQSERQQSQTSLAMQSLLSGTISSQINSVLSTVINSSNWNFGANISTGDEGWNNAEYEGLLSGRLLNNRLLINGQFGYRDNANTASTSFIGDFDIRYLLLPNGNLALKMYNQTNDRYFTKSSLNTQGIGLIMKKDFINLRDLFGKKKK